MPEPMERITQASILTIGIRLLFLIALYDQKQYELHLTASLLFLLLSFFSQRGLGYNLRKAFQGSVNFFCVFLIIYFLGKGIAYIKYQKKAEGFGFGDVLFAAILGSVVQVFLPLSSTVERIYFFSSYLILSCLCSFILLFVHHQKETPSTLPFLPGMIVAFLLLIRYGKEILHILFTLS
jgi:hypothetical protein